MTVRTLSEITVSGTPSEINPIDLDLFDDSVGGPLADGDDITTLLTDIQTAYSAIYVRAPSRSVSVTCDTIAFTTDTFVFLEDESVRNRLTITHSPSDPSGTISLLYSAVRCNTALDYAPAGGSPLSGFSDLPQRTTVMWSFTNWAYIKIGGTNHSITCVGTLPGLGRTSTLTCYDKPAYPTNEIQVGLIDCRVTNTSVPTLADFRLNVHNTEAFGIFMAGWTQAVNATTGRCEQVNVSGRYWNTGGVFCNAVKNIWYDPDRTVISDPYCRGYGWDGKAAKTVSGRLVGAFDRKRSCNGRAVNSAPYFCDSMTGGITFEWGYTGFAPREVKNVGTSDTDPFIVRIKDWGTSGPGTGYTEGVKVKASSSAIFFKGDPHRDYDSVGSPFRFIRFHALPDDYGSGVFAGAITQAEADPSNSWVVSNNYNDAQYNIIRFEANDNDNTLNFGWSGTFQGDFTTTWDRGDLALLQISPENGTMRSWGHVLRAASNMTFTDTVYLLDTDTATGPGTFTDILVGLSWAWWSYGLIQDNLVTDTHVSGSIAIDASAGTTTVDNVEFTGAARAIITIGAGSTAVVTNITVPDGSTITGSGTLTYEGSGESLPFTIPNSTSNATVTSNGVPNPPSGGSVT